MIVNWKFIMTVLIPIKRPDGTIEKITMEEFRARQKKPAAPKLSVSKPVEKKIEKPMAVAKPVFVKPAVKPAQPLSQTAKTEEGKSLLEEELPAGKQPVSRISADRREEAEIIVKKLNFPLSDATRNRLIGLIQLRLKDVRGEMEVKDWLTRPEIQMGIGLSEDKAELVLKFVREFLKQPRKEAPAAPLKRSFGAPLPQISATRGASTALVKEDREPLPATSSPINPFVHAEHHLVKEQPVRAIVRDISPAKPVQLGPIEELRYINLTDFRRLSSNPEEAAARLRQKFTNLKDESYILYMNGLAAWRESPLYVNYTDAAITALNAKAKIAGDGTNKEKIQMPEVRALVEMQKQLV